MALDSIADHPRPWIDHYPEGISWNVALKLTPVHEQVLAACAKAPNAVALDFLGSKTTFGELAEAINSFCGALQRPNTPFYVIAYYAVLKAGGIVVNCNPLYTVHELTHICSNASAEVLVT